MSTELNFASLKVDPNTIHRISHTMRDASIELLLLDTNDTCNADCVYCPNPRTSKRIQLDEFEQLLSGPIGCVQTWQFGCGQEPLIDFRLPQFFEVLQNSRVKPVNLQMITNGCLLGRYRPEVVRKWHLNALYVSIDTADPEVHRSTREDTDLDQIVENLRRFRADHPDISLVFSSVIHRANIDGMLDLIALGDSLGVEVYHLREIYDHTPQTKSAVRRLDYHDWMQKLSLRPGEFAALQSSLAAHPSAHKLLFHAEQALDQVVDTMLRGIRGVPE